MLQIAQIHPSDRIYEPYAQYLVRPDGHVGYRAGGTDLSGVEHYLAHWLPGA